MVSRVVIIVCVLLRCGVCPLPVVFVLAQQAAELLILSSVLRKLAIQGNQKVGRRPEWDSQSLEEGEGVADITRLESGFVGCLVPEKLPTS